MSWILQTLTGFAQSGHFGLLHPVSSGLTRATHKVCGTRSYDSSLLIEDRNPDLHRSEQTRYLSRQSSSPFVSDPIELERAFTSRSLWSGPSTPRHCHPAPECKACEQGQTNTRSTIARESYKRVAINSVQ